MTTRLDLSPDELLATTRAVRKRLDFDRPVPRELVLECIALAQQAPSGSNTQKWHFVVVSDAGLRGKIADIYRKAFALYEASPMYAGAVRHDVEVLDAQQQRVASSADYLAEHLHEAPHLVIPCIVGQIGTDSYVDRLRLGSIMPASWSFMLAARARGLGTCWTSLHLRFEEEVAELLGIPYPDVTQVLLTPLAFTKGTDFKSAVRPDPETITHFDGW